MKIVVIARCRNEERNIDRFCQSYDWVDRIILVDDESDNEQYLINAVRKYKNLHCFRYFGEVVNRDGMHRAAHGRQWNQAIHHAEYYKPDWIIHDDMDCVPNDELSLELPSLLKKSSKNFIYATRVYIYKDRGYCSNISRADGEWQQGLYAWRANKGFRFSEEDPLVHTFDEPDEGEIQRLKPPFALLHYPWPNDETIQKKLEFYNKIYSRETRHPLEYAGKIKELEWWMT